MNANRSKSFTAVVVVSCLLGQLIHAETTLSIGDIAGAPGATLSVPIQFSSDTAVVAAQFELVYQPASLRSGEAVGGSAITSHSVKSSEPTAGVRRII